MNIQQKSNEYTLAQSVIKRKGTNPANMNALEQKIVSNLFTDMSMAIDAMEDEVDKM